MLSPPSLMYFIYTLTLINASILTAVMFVAPSPITLATLILAQTVMMCTLISYVSSIWFSLTLFLLYAGGILVMLMYFAATSPNQIMPLPTTISLATMVFLISTITFSTIPLEATGLHHTHKHNPITAMFLPNNITLLTFLVSILFLTLVAVVTICAHTMSPLRPFTTHHQPPHQP